MGRKYGAFMRQVGSNCKSVIIAGLIPAQAKQRQRRIYSGERQGKAKI